MMPLLSLPLLILVCAASAQATVPKEGARIPGAQFFTPFTGFTVVPRTLDGQQSAAADLQGLLKVSTAYALVEKHGADVFFTVPAKLEINFASRDWVDPKTFGLYRFDGHLWQKSDVSNQGFANKYGHTTASGTCVRNGLFAVFGKYEDVRLANAHKVVFKSRSMILTWGAQRGPEEDWYVPGDINSVEEWSLRGEGAFSTLDYGSKKSEKNKPHKDAGIKLEKRPDGTLWLLQRLGRKSDNPNAFNELALPVHITSGSWENYRTGGSIHFELTEDGLRALNSSLSAMSPEHIELLNKVANVLGVEILTATAVKGGITKRGRLLADAKEYRQNGGVRETEIHFWARLKPGWSVWRAISRFKSIRMDGL